MADNDTTQSGAQGAATSTGQAVAAQTPVEPTTSPVKETKVEDLLSMWTSDEEDVLGVGDIPIKPAEMAQDRPITPVPVQPQPTVIPTPASVIAPTVVPSAPVSPTAAAPAQPLVVPTPQAIQPRPVAPSVPVMPQAPSPAPTPVLAAPTPQPMPPRPMPPPPPARPTSPAPQPIPSVPPARPIQPSVPAPQPAPSPISPRPGPVPSAPVRPAAPAPVPQPPVAQPTSAPRPTPPPAPQPSPRPVQPPPPQPAAPRPPPAPIRPDAVKPETLKKMPPKPIESEKALEGELVDDEEDSSDKVANLLNAIKKDPLPTQEDDGDSFVDQLKELLTELHISPKKIAKWIGCLILLIGIIYGGYYAWTYFSAKGTDIDVTITQPVDTVTKRPVPKNGAETVVESGIPEAVSVGEGTATEPIFISDIGIQAGLIIGQEATATTPLAVYIIDFKLLENTYKVDINLLLNQATDRRARLKAQLLVMNKLYKDANVTLGEIQAEIDALNGELIKHTEAQSVAEKNFFDQLAALNGPLTDVLLEQFTREARDVVALRARSKALIQLQNLYLRGLPRFEARIKDLELNQEALISGIKVYDVAGSDLELIVPVQQEGDTVIRTTNAAGAPTTTVLPGITPIRSQAGAADFITQPGGGF